MGTAKAIAGGLLTGLGTGIVQKAENMRQEAIEQARIYREQLENQDDRRYQESREDFKFERNKGLLHGRETDAQGNVIGIRRSGETFDTGVDAPVKAGDEPGSLSAADKRIWDMVQNRYTTEEYGVKKTDWNAMAAALKDQGREDLAKLAAPGGGSRGTTIDRNSEEWMAARAQAEREADDRDPIGPNWMRPDGVKKAYGDKTREEWLEQRTQEIYAGDMGRGARGTTQKAAPDSASGGKSTQSAGKLPSGSGTQDNPYQPTTQAEFDALPVGAIFVHTDGKLYRKE